MVSRVKKNRWKVFFLVFAFLILLAASLSSAQALEVQYPQVPGAPLPAQPTLPQYIKYLYNLSIILAGLVALFSLVYGGFRYLTSVGQPAAMADARDQVSAGLIGLVILLGAYLFLTIINPQLAILKLDKSEFASVCGNDKCEPGELPRCPAGRVTCAPEERLGCPQDCPSTQIQLTADIYQVFEIPIGTLIKNLIESPSAVARLNTIASRAGTIVQKSEAVKNKAEEFWTAINECSDSCSSADPYCPGCGAATCLGTVCLNRNEVENKKEELKNLANGELAPAMESMLPPLTSLRKDYERLKIGAQILKETIYPINYDEFLEIKQAIESIGERQEVQVIPFFVLGQRIPGRGDPSTFYTDEESVRELIASGQFPTFPRFDTLSGCNECQIDIRFTNFDIPGSAKTEAANYSPEIESPCPNGMDCWDYVINWAKTNNWNPAFILALWREEGGWDKDGVDCRVGDRRVPSCSALGIPGCTGGDILSQLECFPQIVSNCGGTGPDAVCAEDNTSFCSFMRCWSGGASCTLSNNSDFWPVLFDWYNRLIPTAGEGETNPAAPSGNCTTTPTALPPGQAGCPLEPESFSFNGGWHSYCNPGYYHDAVDLGASRGTPVYAVADGVAFGTVDPRGVSYGLGVYVVLQTEFGVFAYAHLMENSHQAANIPSTGKPVAKGDLIGFVDDTGHSFGDHLHLAFYPDGVIQSAHAVPIECLGISCIPVTEAFNLCTDGSQVC